MTQVDLEEFELTITGVIFNIKVCKPNVVKLLEETLNRFIKILIIFILCFMKLDISGMLAGTATLGGGAFYPPPPTVDRYKGRVAGMAMFL